MQYEMSLSVLTERMEFKIPTKLKHRQGISCATDMCLYTGYVL